MKIDLKKVLLSVIKYSPFVYLILLSILSSIYLYDVGTLLIPTIIFSSLLTINLVLAIILRVNDYFIYGISTVALIGSIFVFTIRSVGQLYLENVVACIYIGLFCVAFLPPIFKLKPFTFSFSEASYPEAITKSKVFLKINLVINYLWALIFAGSFLLTIIKYSEIKAVQIPLSIILPIVLQMSIGIPATIKLPALLMKGESGARKNISSVKELLETMPLGLNKDKAKGLDIIIQFLLTGDEPIEGYLEIKNSSCRYIEGVHPTPTTTIKADSNLWLGISNNEISGTKSYINNEYKVEGNMSILMELGSLFSPSSNPSEIIQKKEKNPTSERDETSYTSFAPGKIKNVIVFDSGPRNRTLSKTTFMVDKFIEGIEAMGAKVEYIQLKNAEIKDCKGCYNCWTITPGKCVYKDDMPELLIKYRKADLIVFASPLYIYNVNGIMKRFLDRLIPIVLPYMDIHVDGFIQHPDRFPEMGKQGFVVFSAAGFPDVKNNFDGLVSMFKMFDMHNENLHMMGEFYLPAAETIVQKVYTKRFELVAENCRKAGEQIIKHGKIDTILMDQLQEHDYSAERFKEDSNYFWERLEGKLSYLKEIPKIK